MQRPLADEIRPKTLDEVVGQRQSPGARRGAPPADRLRHRGQHGVLRPLRHRQDHHRQHHRPADQQDSPPAQRHHRVFAGREGHHRRRWDPAGPRRDFAVSGRDPVLQQEAAAESAGVHGERLPDPHRLHHGEPVLLRLRRPALPQHGVRVQGRDAGGGGARCPPGPEDRAGEIFPASGVGGGGAPADRQPPAAAMSERPSTRWSSSARRPCRRTGS